MSQSQAIGAANSASRQAAYRRLALTILMLDVVTLAARLQASRGVPEQPQLTQAA